MSKRTLVTGGGGFLGRDLVRALVERGDTVRVLENDFRGAAAKLGSLQSRVEVQHGDVRDPEAVLRACAGMDSVCHLAAVNGTEHFYRMPDLVLEVGVKGMVNVLEACRAQKVPEFLFYSSSEVYQTPPCIPTDETAPISIPDPLNPRFSYGGSKAIGELLALHWGGKHLQRVLVVRPHNVFGPDMGGEHVIPQLILRLKRLSGESRARPLPFPIQGDGSETRAFIYVSDFTRGVLQVLDRGAHLNLYHIGTMEERSIASVARAISELAEIPIELRAGERTPGSTPRRCPDTRKLQALGFHPEIPFEEGLRRTLEAYWTAPNSACAGGKKP